MTPDSQALEPITYDNYGSASLDAWQAAFWAVYGHKDSEAPLYDLLLQMVADSTRLAEAVRKQQPAEALPYIPRVFTWLCSMVTKCAADPDTYGNLGGTPSLSEIVWRKYPGLCSLCAQPRCMCPFLHLDSQSRAEVETNDPSRLRALETARARTEAIPESVDGWTLRFDVIYGIPHARLSLADKTLHFFEEVGEVEVEMRKADRLLAGIVPPGREEEYEKIEFEDEIADVFSWLISIFIDIANALDRADDFMETFRRKRGDIDTGKPAFRPPTFSEWLWVEFGDKELNGLRCHRCKSPRCECTLELARR